MPNHQVRYQLLPVVVKSTFDGCRAEQIGNCSGALVTWAAAPHRFGNGWSKKSSGLISAQKGTTRICDGSCNATRTKRWTLPMPGEIHGDVRVFTCDRDFKIYRRNERLQIPLIFPE
jgi:hypothetical protein